MEPSAQTPGLPSAHEAAHAPGKSISVSRLSVSRRGRTILHDIDIEIAAGGITALVGPNGCGKSTLLKAVAQVLPAAAGRIAIDNVPLARLSARDVARRLAMLPQSPLLPEGMRVRHLVAQSRHPYRGLLRQWSARDEEVIDRAMADTNIPHLAERPLAALSGGQRQRCWIATTLAQDTSILLLDEPTTYLDLAVQIDIMRLLTRLAANGRTILVVLHELNLGGHMIATIRLALTCAMLLVRKHPTCMAKWRPYSARWLLPICKRLELNVFGLSSSKDAHDADFIVSASCRKYWFQEKMRPLLTVKLTLKTCVTRIHKGLLS